jgi:hyperosmotically inducible periplasmic protein
MLTRYRKWIVGRVLPIILLSFAAVGMASTHNGTNPAGSSKMPKSLTEQVRHELSMLPYLGVFDDLGFTIDNSNAVVLLGQVVRPTLKADAEAVVRRVQGVSKVVNNIEVLPLSSFDDGIRLRTYRAIYSRPGFEKYADQAIAPIKIIVKNGNVTLDGFIGSQMDKILAEMAAKSVLGAFSVTNNLMVN